MKKLIVFIATIFLVPVLKADTTTTRFGITKPTIGTSGWGTKTNNNWDVIDSAVAGQGVGNVFTASNTFTGPTAITSATVGGMTIDNTSGDVSVPFTFDSNVLIGGPLPYVYVTPSGGDDTDEVQAALTKAGIAGTVKMSPGSFFFSSTVYMLNSQHLIGSGKQSTFVTRTGDYGDTIVVGSTTSAAASFEIKGIFFTHGTMYVQGDSSLNYKATKGSHVNVIGGQEGRIEDCIFWRLPYGVTMQGTVYTSIVRCWFQGVWDHTSSNLQEGIAGVFLTTGTSLSLPTEPRITHSLFTGCLSPSRTVTYTDSHGHTKNVTSTENIGSKYGILVYASEGLEVDGGYFGGHNVASFGGNMITGSANLQWRIVRSYFDSARLYSMLIDTQDASTALRNLIVSACTFNGENNAVNGIKIINTPAAGATTKVLTTASITGNTFNNHVGNQISINNAQDVTVTGNSVSYWNSVEASTDDEHFTYVNYVSSSTNVRFSNNVYGITSYGVPFTYFGAGNSNAAENQFVDIAASPIFTATTLSNTTNQITLGATNTTTISSPAPSASRTATIPDMGYDCYFVMSASSPAAAWETYTPTVASQGGTITSVTSITGRYIKIGKLVVLKISFTISNNGTGSAWLNISLPVNAQATLGALSGIDWSSSVGLTGYINGVGNLNVWKYDGTYPGVTAHSYTISLTYEAAS